MNQKIENNKTEQPSISNDIAVANSNVCDFSSTLDLAQNTIIFRKKRNSARIKRTNKKNGRCSI